MEYKNTKADTFQGLCQKIKNSYNEEYYINFLVEFFKIDLKSIVIRYNNGEGLRSIAKSLNIGYGHLKKIFQYYNIYLRTQSERMEILNKKMPEIMMKKYGVKNAFQIPEIVESIQDKLKPKRQEIKEKVKNTCLERYGCENVFQRKDIIKTIKEKLKPKRQEMVQKSLKTKEPYKKEIAEKTRNTLKERYGVENPWQINRVVEKIILLKL